MVTENPQELGRDRLDKVDRRLTADLDGEMHM